MRQIRDQAGLRPTAQREVRRKVVYEGPDFGGDEATAWEEGVDLDWHAAIARQNQDKTSSVHILTLDALVAEGAEIVTEDLDHLASLLEATRGVDELHQSIGEQ